MTIKRSDVDRMKVDFSDVTAGGRLPPIHPGEILRDEFLQPFGLTVYRLARALRIPRPRLNDIVLGRRRITTDTALRLARYFGTTAEFWIRLQSRYDLQCAEPSRRKIELEIEPHGAMAG
ncbi:MAG: HigA family addiction module antitoxin [Gemmatimonadota bacterium]|nr:HigA family addiction module antitoxin [Gemmatimonadota bacterium]MDE2863552.1 HigA family addiction module antitoxin [Gemmatimonadota bacterium]